MTLMYFLFYITIGLSLGWLSRIIAGNRGIGIYTSLTFGVLGSFAGLMMAEIVGLAGDAFLAMAGAIGVLFIANAFRDEEPTFQKTRLT